MGVGKTVACPQQNDEIVSLLFYCMFCLVVSMFFFMFSEICARLCLQGDNYQYHELVIIKFS